MIHAHLNDLDDYCQIHSKVSLYAQRFYRTIQTKQLSLPEDGLFS